MTKLNRLAKALNIRVRRIEFVDAGETVTRFRAKQRNIGLSAGGATPKRAVRGLLREMAARARD
jgi:4-hydroxy-3-methylbut-2-enyl diphosphate reductase IspH